METFLNWNGWMALSVIIQTIVFIPALFMIIYNLRKDKGNFNPKLQMDYFIGISLYKEDESKGVEGITQCATCSIRILNMGVVPIQIESCRLSFGETGLGYDGFGIINPINKQSDTFRLTEETIEILENEWDIPANTPCYIEVVTPIKTLKHRIDLNYGAFIYACRKKIEQVNKANKKSEEERKQNNEQPKNKM